MKNEKLNLSGKGTASDSEIELIADMIIDMLKEFKSPKDAGSAFTLAHYKMICAAFPPKFLKEALSSVDAHNKLVVEFLNEGWK